MVRQMSLVAEAKAVVNRAARRTGYEINRLDSTSTMGGALSRLSQSHPDVRTVIDIGASDGRWSAMARRHFPRSSFLLFEALEAPHAAGLRRFGKLNDVHVVLAAAGDHPGTIHFDGADSFGGAASPVPTGDHDLTVPMTTVDIEVDRLGLRGPFLLKLDTHGFEVPIFEGARRTLDRTAVVIVEAYNFRLRPGALTFPEMCAYLEERGFRVLDIVDLMRRPGDSALWQFDLVFARADRPEFRSSAYG